MTEPLRLAVAGLGRMGAIHALHVHELQRDTGACELAALAEPETERARRFLAETGRDVPVFSSVDELAKSGICQATVIVTPTEDHRAHATALIKAGHRVMLEKPLTGDLDSDREFAAELDREHPDALMLAFQRRFDEPLLYAKKLMESGAIGRVFKIFSAMEDSNPAPNGYKSGGLLPDMSVHNVDEILWLANRTPTKALAIGSRLYSHALTTCEEDFDDASLYLWFGDDLLGQIQVGRNHVSRISRRDDFVRRERAYSCRAFRPEAVRNYSGSIRAARAEGADRKEDVFNARLSSPFARIRGSIRTGV